MDLIWWTMGAITGGAFAIALIYRRERRITRSFEREIANLRDRIEAQERNRMADLTAHAIETARKWLRETLWSARYHEQELRNYRRQLVFYRELATRGGFSPDAPESDCDQDLDAHACLTVEEFVAAQIGDCKQSVKYHQDILPSAQATFTSAKLLLEHLGIEVDLEAMEQEVRRRLD